MDIMRDSPILGGWKQISLTEDYSEFDGSEPKVRKLIKLWSHLALIAVHSENSEVPRESMIPRAVSLQQHD